MQRLSSLPFSLYSVTISARVCVGWRWPPSPAFIIGAGEYIAAASAEPSTGWRIAIISAYPPITVSVSLSVSPLETEEFIGLSKPITLPPRRIIAVENDILVLVEGS